MPTEQDYSTDTKLARIAWLSGRDPSKKFDCLMHHVNEESLSQPNMVAMRRQNHRAFLKKLLTILSHIQRHTP